jgi:hypothetical protein
MSGGIVVKVDRRRAEFWEITMINAARVQLPRTLPRREMTRNGSSPLGRVTRVHPGLEETRCR